MTFYVRIRFGKRPKALAERMKLLSEADAFVCDFSTEPPDIFN